MARIRSLRRWWRDNVLAPLDTTYARIDARVDALTDSNRFAPATSREQQDLASVAPRPTADPKPVRLDRSA